jgi:multidrug resistance efflux pump
MNVSQLRGYASPYDEILGKAKGLRLSPRHLLIGAAAGLLLIVAALYADYWWTTGRFLVSTDDAYVRAHSVLISPKVSGYIAEVPVDDNQTVKAGQVLARIDPRDYQTALDQARANVAAAQASIETLNRQILAPASGEEFALLPPDNATGNFTKIVQRIPVKIAIDTSDPLFGRLRPGMSVEPTIDTRPGSSAPPSARAP